MLDLDETLIHSHHDGVIRQTVKPGTPPDFVLKVVIDRHPVRFFVHKRPHVDFFLDIVRKLIVLYIPRFCTSDSKMSNMMMKNVKKAMQDTSMYIIEMINSIKLS